jgi:hypothetical protein
MPWWISCLLKKVIALIPPSLLSPSPFPSFLLPPPSRTLYCSTKIPVLVKIEVSTYKKILEACVKVKNEKIAKSIFDKVYKESPSSLLPSLPSLFHSMVQLSLLLDDPYEAHRYIDLHLLLYTSFPPSPTSSSSSPFASLERDLAPSYLMLLIYRCRKREWEEVNFLFREIRDHRIKMGVRDYNRFLDAVLETVAEIGDSRNRNLESDFEEGGKSEHDCVLAISVRLLASSSPPCSHPYHSSQETPDFLNSPGAPNPDARKKIMGGRGMNGPWEGREGSQEYRRGERAAVTQLLLDTLEEMTNSARILPDWVTFQILLKISKILRVLELQHSILRVAKKSGLPRAFLEDMWAYIKGCEEE